MIPLFVFTSPFECILTYPANYLFPYIFPDLTAIEEELELISVKYP
jgi:hypothetical protein